MFVSRNERFNESIDSTKSIGFYSSTTTSLLNPSHNVYAGKGKSPRVPHRPNEPNSSSKGKYNRSPRGGGGRNNNNHRTMNGMQYTAAELASAALPIYAHTHGHNNGSPIKNLQFGSSLENDETSLGGTGALPIVNYNNNHNQSNNQNYNNMNVNMNIHNTSLDTVYGMNMMSMNNYGYSDKEVRDATRSFFKVVENAERITTRPTIVITTDDELTELEEFEEFDAMQKKLEEDNRRGRMAGAFSKYLKESMEKRLEEEAREAELLALDEECEEKVYLEVLENTVTSVLEQDLHTMIAMERGLYLVTEEFLINTQVTLMDEVIFEAIEFFKRIDMGTQTDNDSSQMMTVSVNNPFESVVLSAVSSVITFEEGSQSQLVSPTGSVFDINAPASEEEEEEEEEDADIYGIEFSDNEDDDDDDGDDGVFNVSFV